MLSAKTDHFTIDLLGEIIPYIWSLPCIELFHTPGISRYFINVARSRYHDIWPVSQKCFPFLNCTSLSQCTIVSISRTYYKTVYVPSCYYRLFPSILRFQVIIFLPSVHFNRLPSVSPNNILNSITYPLCLDSCSLLFTVKR